MKFTQLFISNSLKHFLFYILGMVIQILLLDEFLGGMVTQLYLLYHHSPTSSSPLSSASA